MAQLWYNDDEVRKFHPLVEDSLNQILSDGGFSGEYAVEHHPMVPGSSKTPDFSIYKKRSRRIIFILEVKRTERDVDSQRYWNQTRGYVRDLTHNWEPGSKYFAITNIEKTITFADRNGADTGCVLSGNPISAGKFDPETHDADEVVEQFKNLIKPTVVAALSAEAPEWADAWQPIIDSFTVNLRSVIDELTQGRSEPQGKEIGTYELLRVFLYHFISSYYGYTHSSNAKYFRSNRLSSDAGLAFREAKNNYERALELDFKQIFSDSPTIETRITEEQFERILLYFNSFVETLQSYISDAVKQNHSPEYFFNLLTENLYAHEELHKQGKVMSDSELASLIAELCIDSESVSVLDPGCGDGALLSAAYDKLRALKSRTNPAVTHQEVLNQVNGLEVDPFLTQLSAFRLLMKNPHEVDEDTEASIETADIFKHPNPSQYDVVVMNPPFLRNEESSALVGSSTGQMIAAIRSVGEDPFVTYARQPNLYFYFVNYVDHYLKDNGTMGLILMSKFMNNQDAVHLKRFMKDKVEAVISYPKSYFQQFKVTTSIVILRKNSRNESVKFLNLRTDALLSEPSKVRAALESNDTTIVPDYSLKVVPRDMLNADFNWKTYLLDPEDRYEKIQQFDGLTNLTNLFDTIKRGVAGNSGGSDLVFPSPKSDVALANKTPVELLCNGMRWNKISGGSRHYVLTKDDFIEQKAIDFPEPFNDSNSTGYEPSLENPFLEALYEESSSKYTSWKKILNEAVASKVKAQILIPRADRTKHAVYYNATNEKVVLSTNFFALADFKNKSDQIDDDKQLKFVSAFLLSSFGQLQFELLANDQEGMRKLEGFMIAKLKVLDPQKVPAHNIEAIVAELDAINNSNEAFSGVEGTDTPRMALDLAIAESLLDMGISGFDNKEKLAKYVQKFLADIVEERLS